MLWSSWLVLVAVALPGDLVGDCPPPELAWSLDGVPPGAAVVGCAPGEEPLLLVGGRRGGTAAPPLGDLALVSPRGWARRRLTAPGGLVGLPAVVRQLVLAATGDGVLQVWPLDDIARELAPWRVRAEGDFRVGPLVVGQTLVFAAGGRVAAVTDLIEPRWSTDLGAVIDCPLASDGQAIYAATGRELVALTATEGTPLWRVELPAAPATGLLLSAGLILYGDDAGNLQARDTADGEAVWSQAVGGPFAQHLALAGPWLVAAAGARLLALDTLTGEPVWQAPVPAPASSPVIGFGRIFVTAGGRLHALPCDPEQPPLEWGAEGLELTGQPTLWGRRVYVTTAGGRLLALDLPDARGAAPWPVAGGTPQRNGRVIPAGEE